MTTIIIQYWGKVEWRRRERRESRRSVWRRMARPYITWEFLWALSTKEEINLLCLPQPLPPPLSATAYSALLHYRPPLLWAAIKYARDALSLSCVCFFLSATLFLCFIPSVILFADMLRCYVENLECVAILLSRGQAKQLRRPLLANIF